MERHPERAFLSKIDVFEDYENKGLLLQIVSLSFKKKIVSLFVPFPLFQMSISSI